MKKLFLLSLALSVSVCAFSQTRARLSKSQRDQSFQREFAPANDESAVFTTPVNPTVSRALAPDETQMGTTMYDKQTNASLSNRFYRYDDGKIAAVWTMGMTATGSWPDRGTGYNYFDGTTWGPEPTARIETQRCGWPSYAPLGANGEMVVAHLAANLNISTRAQKGSGAWTESTLAGPATANTLTWPRVVTSGPGRNTIHVLANSYAAYEGQTTAILYSRSEDGGATWDITNQVIPGTGADSYLQISADQYVWAEPRANTLAFVVGSPWIDLFLMKSVDNGDTWTKTIIWENPYPFFDFASTQTTDTIWAPESISVALDYTGKAHVAFGIGRVAHPEITTTYSFWPYTDGIGYWNEDMPAFTNDNQHKALCTDPGFLVENVNLIGWMQDMDGDGTITLIDPPYSYNPQIGMSTMPSITVDESNAVVVAYASLMENHDNTIFNYKHVWLRASADGGASWLSFYDATGSPIHAYDECIYPLLAANTDANIHLMYNADDTPGLTLSTVPDHDPQENRQNYSMVAKSELGLVSTSFNVTASSFPVAGGTVAGGGNFASGAQATLTAVPNTYYSFTNWTENGEVVSTNATYTFTVTGNRVLVANFFFGEGIAEQNVNISVLPNPTSGILKIQSSQLVDKVMVYNSLGVNVKTIELNQTDCKIDLSDQLKGVYYLQIVINDKLLTRKIVVK